MVKWEKSRILHFFPDRDCSVPFLILLFCFDISYCCCCAIKIFIFNGFFTVFCCGFLLLCVLQPKTVLYLVHSVFFVVIRSFSLLSLVEKRRLIKEKMLLSMQLGSSIILSEHFFFPYVIEAKRTNIKRPGILL